MALACLLAFFAVGLGAFGAHILRDRLSESMLETFRTGVDYHALHAIALLFVAMLWRANPEATKLKWTCILFSLGILIFSGSLYALALSGVRWLGAITPIGGVCFLTGWLIAAVAVASLPEYRNS